jgi:N-acetylneuraminate synthase
MAINKSVFDELFVLELANNHRGRVDRGLTIIQDFSQVVRYNGIRAAIKLQFRDVDSFIHQDYRERTDLRYIKKTIDTNLSVADFSILVEAIRKTGCIPMATPFDEKSVDLCVRFDIPIIKIASSDINDWVLIEAIAKTKRPVIASTGGSQLKDMDDLVTFFERRNIPLALNHCISLYPTSDSDLDLNQIDFLRDRYPNVVIGHSTHEYGDWHSSIMIAYAKGARTFERHIDIDAGGIPVAKYCSLPEQIDEWFRAFNKAKEMCGGAGTTKRVPSAAEIEYLDALVRGVYAKRNLPEGHDLTAEDVVLAIPLLKGQLSCRELIAGERLVKPLMKGEALTLDAVDNAYSRSSRLRQAIESRGLDPAAPPAVHSLNGIAKSAT